jgi:hypothetical protein
MKDLDQGLRDALRRESPPAGFAERVLQRAEEDARRDETPPPRLLRWSPRRPLVRLAAAAALVAAVAGGIQYRNVERARAERAAGEAAKEQVIKALRITASTLQVVQEKVREVGS